MQKRPNILFIMADQFRTATLTGMGDGIETPNIDRLRAVSMFFPQAACTSPLCTPSRASLATGKMPHRCGVHVHDADLPLDEITYYQRLVKAGYRTAVFGKTDLHKKTRWLGKNGDLPVIHHLGFTSPFETEGKMNSGLLFPDENGTPRLLGPYQNHLARNNPDGLHQLNQTYRQYMRGGKKKYESWESHLHGEDFIDCFIGEHACRYLQQVDDEAPWHLFVSFAGPHNPWDPPAEYYERTKQCEYPLPPKDELQGKPRWVQARAAQQSDGLDEQALLDTKRHYAASATIVDDYVGRFLDTLEQRGLLDNTIVIFTADHGEQMGEHSLFEKTVMYEGALRIPMLIHLPGMACPSESNALASLMDLAPTLLELGNADYNPSDMDAESLVPILTGQREQPLRPVQQSELHNCMMLYDGRYKWIRSFNDQDELYDLQSDPHELHNCIAEHPEIIQRLQKYTYRH